MAVYLRDLNGILHAWEIAGYKGKDGITPNLTIGNVVTLQHGQQATVTFRGDKENPIIDFGIPKGQDGLGSDNMNLVETKISEPLKEVAFDEATYNLIFTKYNNQELRIDLSQIKTQLDGKAQSLAFSQDGNSLQLKGVNDRVLSDIPLMTQNQVNEIKNLFV